MSDGELSDLSNSSFSGSEQEESERGFFAAIYIYWDHPRLVSWPLHET